MEAQELYLWPYDEVEISFTKDEVRLQAPWAKASLAMEVPSSVQARASHLLKNGIESKTDLLLLQKIFSPFAHLPLFYVLPRSYLFDDRYLRGIETNDEQSRWNTSELLELASLPSGRIDPIALLSALRRKHLLDVVTYPHATNMAQIFREASGETRPAVIFAIRQNHYVTVRCHSLLTPALDLHPEAATLIDDFIESEQGHDKLLEASLRELEVDADHVSVSSSLVAVLDRFEQIASDNLIAFAFTVDMFERSSPERRSSVCDELARLGETKAAAPLLAHLSINVDGAHDNESLKLLGPVGSINRAYALRAIHLSQQISDLMLIQAAHRYQIMKLLISTEDKQEQLITKGV